MSHVERATADLHVYITGLAAAERRGRDARVTDRQQMRRVDLDAAAGTTVESFYPVAGSCEDTGRQARITVRLYALCEFDDSRRDTDGPAAATAIGAGRQKSSIHEFQAWRADFQSS